MNIPSASKPPSADIPTTSFLSAIKPDTLRKKHIFFIAIRFYTIKAMCSNAVKCITESFSVGNSIAST
jgi:hypothetical protein